MAAKLLENQPASEVEAGHPHARLVVIGAVLVLVLGLGVGLWLIRPPGEDPEPVADVSLVTWAAAASEVCRETGDNHPVLTAGAEARRDAENLGAVDAGVRDLTSGIRELPMPTDPGEAAMVGETIRIGDEAGRAWAVLSSEAVTTEEMGNAATLTDAYISGLVELGADCSALG